MPRPTRRSTAVLVPAREKLGLIGECLDALLRHSDDDVHVYVVEVGYAPERVAELEELSAGRDDLTIVRGVPPVLANAGFNLALAASTEPYVCVVENDVIVTAGYRAALQEAIDESGADLASPRIMDRRTSRIHFDPPVSEIERAGDGYRSTVVRRPKPDWPEVAGRRWIAHLEKHSFAGTRAAMEALAPLDEDICTRTDIDLSLTAHRAGLRIRMVPDAVVEFTPPPIGAEDLAFFAHRWDVERACSSNAKLVAKWNLVDDPGYLHFVDEMRAFLPVPS